MIRRCSTERSPYLPSEQLQVHNTNRWLDYRQKSSENYLEQVAKLSNVSIYWNWNELVVFSFSTNQQVFFFHLITQVCFFTFLFSSNQHSFLLPAPKYGRTRETRDQLINNGFRRGAKIRYPPWFYLQQLIKCKCTITTLALYWT